MNLFINSPSHYTQKYGVIDEVYAMCEYISKSIDIKNYTDAIDTIGIVPMIAPDIVLESADWKERKYVSTTYRMASISISSDYKQFYNGDVSVKKEIILKNILDSLKIVKKKLKGKFDYDQIERDILSIYNKYNEY